MTWPSGPAYCPVGDRPFLARHWPASAINRSPTEGIERRQRSWAPPSGGPTRPSRARDPKKRSCRRSHRASQGRMRCQTSRRRSSCNRAASRRRPCPVARYRTDRSVDRCMRRRAFLQTWTGHDRNLASAAPPPAGACAVRHAQAATHVQTRFIAAQCLRHETWHHSHWPGRVRGARRMNLA